MGGHGLRDGEETGGERADAELLEVLARDDGLWRRRDFDAHAGPERRTQRKEGRSRSVTTHRWVRRNAGPLWDAVGFEEGHELLGVLDRRFGVVCGGGRGLGVHAAGEVRVDLLRQQHGL